MVAVKDRIRSFEQSNVLIKPRDYKQVSLESQHEGGDEEEDEERNATDETQTATPEVFTFTFNLLNYFI